MRHFRRFVQYVRTDFAADILKEAIAVNRLRQSVCACGFDAVIIASNIELLHQAIRFQMTWHWF
jgi:hypothetical protein